MKIGKIKLLFVSALLFIAVSCVDETFFGESNLNKILYFTFEGQVGNTSINQDSLIISATVGESTDITAVKPDSVLLSTFAQISPGIDEYLDFSSPVEYLVTAENGSQKIYTAYLIREGSEPQLENSNFDQWYQPIGKSYYQPGADENSIWATANSGVTILGDDKANTLPLQISGSDYAAELITRDLGPLSLGQRMAAATLFTGKFELNLLDPPSSAKFGLSFSAKPKAFSVDIKYAAGTPYKSNTGKELDKIDSADVYLLLENRENIDNIKRIGTGWLRIGDISEFENITVDIIYGELPTGTPDYQYPGNGMFGSEDDKVTHISVVFTSSANGITYEGGVNSTLIVNNFKLIY